MTSTLRPQKTEEPASPRRRRSVSRADADAREPMLAVGRTSNILLSFTQGKQMLGVTDIARALGLPKSAVHRTLVSLVETGLVARNPGTARYRLGPRAVELGLASLGSPDLRTLAAPLLQDLVRQTDETATVTLLVGMERVYVAQVESPQHVRMSVELGRRYHLYAGASGRVILAFFSPREIAHYVRHVRLEPITDGTIVDVDLLLREGERIRENGYAISFGERDPWAASVAAPIRHAGGRVIGSMSICGPLARFEGSGPERYGPLVRAAADQLSQQLG